MTCLCEERRPGVARRASNFLSSRRKKVTKERATLLRASLRCATGNLRCSDRGCAAELTARYALRSNNCGKSVHEVRVSFGTRTPPLPCASRRSQKGTPKRTSTRAIASLRCARPRLAGASATRCANWAERSDGPCGCPAVRLSIPCWLRLRRGGCGVSMGVAAPMPRELTRRSCLNGARQRAVSSAAHPATDRPQVCPFAPRRGRRLGVAFLLGTFLWRSKEKYLARRGDSRPPPSPQACG